MNTDQPAVRSSVDAVLTLALTEGLRVRFGIDYIGAANTIYGILLVLCIHLHAARRRRRAAGIKLKRAPWKPWVSRQRPSPAARTYP